MRSPTPKCWHHQCRLGQPFFSEVVRGIEEAATKADYHILLASTEESVKKEADLIKMFLCR